MRTTFSRFDKGAFLKIHCYTIVIRSYLIVDRSQIFFYNFRGLLSKLLRYAIIWFLIFNCGPTAYTGASLILEKFSVGTVLMTQPVFQSLLVDHIWMLLLLQRIFWEDPVLVLLYLIVEHLYECFSCFRVLFH